MNSHGQRANFLGSNMICVQMQWWAVRAGNPGEIENGGDECEEREGEGGNGTSWTAPASAHHSGEHHLEHTPAGGSTGRRKETVTLCPPLTLVEEGATPSPSRLIRQYCPTQQVHDHP